MRKSLVRKGLVLGIIVLFVGASVVPSISENIREQGDISSLEDQSSDVISDVVFGDITENNDVSDFEKTVIDKVDNNEESDESEKDRSYDWPTFQHDMQRTGYGNGVGDIDLPSVRWRFFSEEPFTWNSVIGDIDNENEIVACDVSGMLFCIDGSTGLEEWSTNAAGKMTQPSLYDVVDDGDIEIIGYGDGGNGDDPGVYCLDGSTGTIEWTQLNFHPTTQHGFCAIDEIDCSFLL